MAYDIRLIGDPVLKSPAAEVTDIDERLARLVREMTTTMYDAPGVGLAAPQVGVGKRLFVYDLRDEAGARTLVNPRIVESRGSYVFEEGCLSVPGLTWEIERPDEIHLVGRDLDGNEVSIEASGYEGRVFQHELDHLDGILLIERLDDDQRKAAKKAVQEMLLARQPSKPATDGASAGGLSLR